MLAGVSLVSGCDGGGTECACSSAGITVSLPSQLVGQLQQVVASGPACQGATVSPSVNAGTHATTFHIDPVQPGSCQLELYFGDGTSFSDELTVVESSGCCGGLRTSPPGAADIGVPASREAGATGD
jgi:hypothetical protein